VDTHLLLLRGVNVGGHNRVPMADLRALLAGLGCEDVVTYLQSGNAVCRSGSLAEQLASATEGAIEAELGVTVRVVPRSSAQWAATVAGNPLLDLDDDPKRLHVAFLDAVPDPDRVDALVTESEGLAPERLAVSGPDVYLHTPAGYHQAKLTNAFLERRLGRVGTARNWRTVLALADLAGVSP
jgi:uncharacterized protein (DUF1697 family)